MSEHTISATCNLDPRLEARPRRNDAPKSPRAILNDESLSKADKRELLASLASDLHAVPDQPALRRGNDGTVFDIDELLKALKMLDRATPRARGVVRKSRHDDRLQMRHRRPLRDVWFINRNKERGPDDDDDPPPCPATARPFGPAPVDGSVGALVAA
jgi:hypothetical protein